MKKTLIYLLLIFILNIIGSILLKNFYSEYYKISGFANYFVIGLIAFIYHFGNMSKLRIIKFSLFPLVFLLFSLLIVLMDIVFPGLENAFDILYMINSVICSLFEVVNITLSQISSDLIREANLYFFNTIGISLIFLMLAIVANYVDNKI